MSTPHACGTRGTRGTSPLGVQASHMGKAVGRKALGRQRMKQGLGLREDTRFSIVFW